MDGIGTLVAEAFPLYHGYEIMDFNDQQMADLYSGNINLNLFENEYVVIRDVMSGSIVDIRRFSNGEFLPLKTFSVDTYHFGKIKPRNLQQRMGFDLLGTKGAYLMEKLEIKMMRTIKERILWH